MAIVLLRDYLVHESETIVRDLSYHIEQELVDAGFASFDLSEGSETDTPTFDPALNSERRAELHFTALDGSSQGGGGGGGQEPAPVVLAQTGWGFYQDDALTVANPLTLNNGVSEVLANNAAVSIQSELPSDVATFYQNGRIQGQLNDLLDISIDFTFSPVGTSYQTLTVGLDTGSGLIYAQRITTPRGAGQEMPMSFKLRCVINAEWVANGAQVLLLSGGVSRISNVSYLINRAHKAKAVQS